MSGFGGGFGGSSGFGAGGFGSTTPLPAPTFGAAPSMPGLSSTSTPSSTAAIFGSSPNISTTGFGGGDFTGSFTGSSSSTVGGFGSTGGVGGGIGGGGGFGFGSSTTSSAFPSAPFNTTSTSGGFGSTPSSSTPSSLGGFGGFGANSSTLSSGGGFGNTDSADMGFEDSTTPSFGTTTTATPFQTQGFGASSGGGFGGTTATFGTTPATSTAGFGAGSGFGASTNTTFGTAPISTSFGGTNSGGFGTPITFGSATNTASTGGFVSTNTGSGGGFGSSTAFGTASATSMGGFGGNSTGGGFGTSTAFGNASTTSTGGFGTSTGGGFGTSMTFGNAPTSSTGGFGGSATGEFGTPSGGFGTSSAGSFGGTTPGAGFGTSTTFGTSTGAASFGTHTGSTTTSSGAGFGTNFGTNAGGMFSTATTPSSDFGTSSSGFGTAPTMAFGASSNVVTGSSSNQQLRFGQANSTGWQPKPSANPFAPSNSQDDGMMGDETTLKPNGSNPQSTFPTSNNMTFGRSPNRTAFQATTSPIPEENEMGEDEDDEDDFSAAAKQRADEESRLKAKIEEKKRLLQTKIEEKKKKLMEKQRQKSEQSTTPEVTSHQDAQDSARTNKALAERNAVRFGEQEKSLAKRNAIRFGEQDRSSTREMLPPAMRAKAERVTPPPVISHDSDQQRSTEREDLKTAKALVGTCQHFCPEEELLRREREGDIQQLEIPLPGKLHPPHWTLQQTAVKRFRRSAADYKLDVPEWVRPPDVLEQVCGYLEEWVMERDRQGPDPRFPQGQTPPPLEVYQFIWDRTRMIRKDFTLQNYVGTGGKCDARAVRCHERIARWHAMCEHQLSHIPEFVTMQSQQNIQELGQTMKTLNQFYDDSLKRATVEVPNENGHETRLDLTGFSHGCTSNRVQGQSPMEFDGSELNNTDHDPQVAKRILGKHAVNHPAHGTAEPEMRGLYMLLTMNNEGGMEVLKNAARLFQERPDIYASNPVQLALEIFKAKKEYNYARFFSILRAPTTPYLFCCIMFKHVELMRKIAFRIMSKSFGARKKDTGEAIYDAYPLSRLVELLCFEDVDEARAACNHYNITVQQVQVSASREEVAEIIFWRASEFKEPIHPEKGYVLPLQPRKMTRIIEQKLHGATRLAVCRGEVSGEGATVHAVAPSTTVSNVPQPQANISNVAINVPNKKTSEDEQEKLVQRQNLEASRLEQEAVLREQERLQLERDEKKKEEERLAQEAKQKRAKELEKQRLLQELELKNQEAEKLEEQRRKEELEKEAIAARIREEAKRRELEAEAKRRQEEALQKAEEERRAAEESRRREEEARIETERLHLIAEEQRRKEEAQRQALLRRERERKREQEAEEKRKANEWEDKVNAARRLVLWRRWQNRLSRSIVMTKGSAASLEQLDPTFLSHTLKLGSWFQSTRMARSEHDADEVLHSTPRDMRRAIDACVRGNSPKISLSGLVVREMAASQQLTASTDNFDGVNADTKTTLLLKVALLIPSLDGNDSQAFLDLLKGWIHSRIGLNEVFTEELRSYGARTSFEARSIVRHCRNAEDSSDCDVALIIVPPPWSTSDERRRKLSSIRSLIDDSLPRIALVLGEFDHEGHEYMKSMLAETLGTTNGTLPIVCTRSATPMALEKALDSSCSKLAKIFVNESCIKVDRISVPRLVARAVSMGLWNSSVSTQQVVDCNVVLETARRAVSAFIESANIQVLENEGVWSFWPSREFVSENGVDSYFSNDAHLPCDWISSLSRQSLDQELSLMTQRLTGSFRDVVESFLLEAPTELREECGMLISRGYYRRGLQAAMHWFSVHSQADKSMNSYIYFPRGLMEVIFDELEFTDQGVVTKNVAPALLLPQDNVLLDAIEEIDQTMKKATEPSSHFESYDISILASVNNNKRRHHDTNSTEGKSPSIESPSMMRDFVETKKFRPSRQLLPNSKVDLEESAAFSQRLQNLMMGATVELEVGGDYLSNILRNAPELSNCL